MLRDEASALTNLILFSTHLVLLPYINNSFTIKQWLVCLTAAEVRILYILKQLARNREGFSRHESVTLEEVFRVLRRHISTVSISLVA